MRNDRRELLVVRKGFITISTNTLRIGLFDSDFISHTVEISSEIKFVKYGSGVVRTRNLELVKSRRAELPFVGRGS